MEKIIRAFVEQVQHYVQIKAQLKIIVKITLDYPLTINNTKH